MALPFVFAVGGALLAARARLQGRSDADCLGKTLQPPRHNSSYLRWLIHSELSDGGDNGGRSASERPLRVLLCATGSVATVKVRGFAASDSCFAFELEGVCVCVFLGTT